MPGSGCAASEGYNRMHAILGASEHCIADQPSDMNVALAALDARVVIASPQGRTRRTDSATSTACPAIRRRSTRCWRPAS